MPSTWMTYEELAVARGIAVKSAKTLARRHHWARQIGNDGKVRVSLPIPVDSAAAGFKLRSLRSSNSIAVRNRWVPDTTSKIILPVRGPRVRNPRP